MACGEVPPGFEAVAVTTFAPGVNVMLLQLQLPVTVAVVEQVCPFGPCTVTEASGVAVPETVGDVVAVPPLVGLTIATVGGAKAVKLTVCAVVPPGPEAVTVTGVTPAVTVTGHENVPDAEAVVVQSVTGPGPVMTTVLPGVAVPTTGCVNGPTTGGATVSVVGPATVKVLVVVAVPPGLLTNAVILFVPVVNAVGMVAVKPPVGLAKAVTLLPLEAVSVRVLPGVAVPLTTFTPEGCVVLLAGLRIATVGRARAVKVVGTAVVPPGPVAVTVRVFGPTGTITGQAYVPDAEAVVAQSVTVPGPTGFTPVITIALPGVAVPAMVGVVVVDTFTGEVTVRLGTAATVKLVWVGLLVPPALPATTVTVFTPAVNEVGNVAV